LNTSFGLTGDDLMVAAGVPRCAAVDDEDFQGSLMVCKPSTSDV
jgi:hypothetical protein